MMPFAFGFTLCFSVQVSSQDEKSVATFECASTFVVTDADSLTSGSACSFILTFCSTFLSAGRFHRQSLCFEFGTYESSIALPPISLLNCRSFTIISHSIPVKHIRISNQPTQSFAEPQKFFCCSL